ncbi:MAG: Glyoxalase/bleomycin resistance protein/dioxygenase [Phenylobacterium sp.]|nr:Glyoxalase/bleomycin resistance protein/dioxygenase [Phenylobacterium sp.]
MSQVQVEQKSYQMPPQEGFTVAHFLTVADIERSALFYETVFGGRILSKGDSSGAPGVHPDREHLAHCQRWGRSDTRQTIGNTQRPPRLRFSEQLYEHPRCGYSSVL